MERFRSKLGTRLVGRLASATQQDGAGYASRASKESKNVEKKAMGGTFPDILMEENTWKRSKSTTPRRRIAFENNTYETSINPRREIKILRKTQ